MADSSYFLEPDDAKTFGDIDYMRTAKTVKHTFANGTKRASQISATSETLLNESGLAAESSVSKAADEGSSPAASNESKRSQNSSATDLDMFRKMAKDIGKG